MKIYKEKHETKNSLDNHIFKIKKRNGVCQVMEVNNKYHLEYSFPDNNKVSKPILNAIKKSLKNKSLTNFIEDVNSKEYGGDNSFNVPIANLFPTLSKTEIKSVSMSKDNPISLIYKGGLFFITDGNHRYYEAIKRGDDKISCRIDKTHKVRLMTLFNAL